MNDLMTEWLTPYVPFEIKSISCILPVVGQADHHGADCFVLIILSHGDEEGVYGVDGVISPDKLIEPIKGNKCPDLTGKPKLIFIQVTTRLCF